MATTSPNSIDTERLLLRRPVPEDVPAMFENGSNPEVARFMDWPICTDIGQVFVILEGEVELVLEDRRHSLRSGDSLHVPAGVRHQFRNDSPRPVRFLVISAPRRGWDRIQSEHPGMPAPDAPTAH